MDRCPPSVWQPGNALEHIDQHSQIYILRTARGFWKCCKNGVGWILSPGKSHTLLIDMKTFSMKIDIVGFTINSVLLIGPIYDDCTEERNAREVVFCCFCFFFFFFAIRSSIFSPSFLFPLFHSSFLLSCPRIYSAQPLRLSSLLHAAAIPRYGWKTVSFSGENFTLSFEI